MGTMLVGGNRADWWEPCWLDGNQTDLLEPCCLMGTMLVGGDHTGFIHLLDSLLAECFQFHPLAISNGRWGRPFFTISYFAFSYFFLLMGGGRSPSLILFPLFLFPLSLHLPPHWQIAKRHLLLFSGIAMWKGRDGDCIGDRFYLELEF